MLIAHMQHLLFKILVDLNEHPAHLTYLLLLQLLLVLVIGTTAKHLASALTGPWGKVPGQAHQQQRRAPPAVLLLLPCSWR